MRLCFLPLTVSTVSLCLFAGCGGSSNTSSTPSPAQPAPPPVAVSNPTPGIASIQPASIVAGSPAQTLTITGIGFIAASVVTLNGTALQTTYTSATMLTAAVPATALASGQVDTLTVTNPASSGGSSPMSSPVSSYNITSPVPAVADLSPQSVPQGLAVTITVNGSGFEANSSAQWNGSGRPTTFVNGTTLQVALTAADVQTFGSGQITVNNPGPGGTVTTPVALAILAAKPTITSISPSAVAVSTSNVPQRVFISGSGFAATATVQVNGQAASISSRSAASITVSLPAGDFSKAGSLALIVTNPGSPAVSSNSALLSVTQPSTAGFRIQPSSVPAGSPATTITLVGTGFFPDSVAQWNGIPLATKYNDASSLTAVIPASLLAGFANANIGVVTPENTGQAPPTDPFTTYLALSVNDIAYNAKDGLIYASVPGSAGPGLGNSIAAIDPTTGVIQKTIFVGSEPNRLTISTDGTQLFVGLDGAGAVRQVDLTAGTAGVQFSLGGGPGVYNAPYTAQSLAALPGSSNSVAVYGSNGVVNIFDSGVARTTPSSGLETYFTSNVGGLAFGSSASSLYLTSDATGSYLYDLTVGTGGITASKQLATGYYGTNLQYDKGRLYVPTGTVLDAATGSQLGQFSSTPSYSNIPSATSGPIVSDSTLNLAWIVPSNPTALNQILSFDETSFNPVASLPLGSVSTGSTFSSGPADLIRWGQNGLAFHTGSQLFVVQGPFVNDVSTMPADLVVIAQVPAAATTGSALTYTVQVQNQGPNTATGATLLSVLPQSIIFGSVKSSQGSCFGTGEIYCDLGTIASGSAATVTVTTTPSTSGTAQLTAVASSTSYDPAITNNQATAKTAITGNLFSSQPIVTQLSPSLVQAGADTFTLTVNGTGFSNASAVLWNGQALPTTFVNGGQLTASINTSLVKQLGWAEVSVSSAAPGGGISPALTLSIYQLINVPANVMTYDPFTRQLYAALPSTSKTLAGNSLVAIDPTTGSIGSPVQVGSEPNLLSETSDGNYLYIGLSGAKSLGRFNLLNQSLDLTVPIPTTESYQTGNAPAVSIAAVPGTDTSVAIEESFFNQIGIFDIVGNTGTFRKKFSTGYSGDNPVFVDPSHFYAYDAQTSGEEFYRFSIDSDGVTFIDGTTLLGFGGYGGQLAVDDGLVYGSGGGIVNPSTTPPSQIAVLPLGSGLYQTPLIGGGTVPYASESKSFNIGVNIAGSELNFLQRFDTQHFLLEDQIQLPGSSSISAIKGTRWGQDGLAYVLAPQPGSTAPSQIFLLRGPFVLPAEAVANAIPTLTGTDHSTLTAGTGNLYITATGSGFLPGATVLVNSSPRTTGFVDSAHLSVAIPASDVQSAGTLTLTSQNPGSGASGSVSISVH